MYIVYIYIYIYNIYIPHSILTPLSPITSNMFVLIYSSSICFEQFINHYQHMCDEPQPDIPAKALLRGCRSSAVTPWHVSHSATLQMLTILNGFSS